MNHIHADTYQGFCRGARVEGNLGPPTVNLHSYRCIPGFL